MVISSMLGAGLAEPESSCGVVTRHDFVDELMVAVPESEGLVLAHLADNDEMLLHLLMSDLLRLTVSAFSEGKAEAADRLLAFVDRCLRYGDEDVANAVSVSFVENYGALPGECEGLLARWPPALRAELHR